MPKVFKIVKTPYSGSPHHRSFMRYMPKNEWDWSCRLEYPIGEWVERLPGQGPLFAFATEVDAIGLVTYCFGDEVAQINSYALFSCEAKGVRNSTESDREWVVSLRIPPGTVFCEALKLETLIPWPNFKQEKPS